MDDTRVIERVRGHKEITQGAGKGKSRKVNKERLLFHVCDTIINDGEASSNRFILPPSRCIRHLREFRIFKYISRPSLVSTNDSYAYPNALSVFSYTFISLPYANQSAAFTIYFFFACMQAGPKELCETIR